MNSCEFYTKTENSPKDICSLIWRDRFCICLGNQINCDYRFMLLDYKKEGVFKNEQQTK